MLWFASRGDAAAQLNSMLGAIGCRWATRQADKLDPIASGSFRTLEDKRRTTFQDDERVPGVVELIWRRMVKRSHHVEKGEVWWGDSSRWPWL